MRQMLHAFSLLWHALAACYADIESMHEILQGKRERKYQMLHALHLVALRQMIKQHCHKKGRCQLTSTPVSGAHHAPSPFGPPPAAFLSGHSGHQ